MKIKLSCGDDVTDINECLMNPCLHGGRCINSPGSFSCQCPEGWMGPLCDIGNALTSIM